MFTNYVAIDVVIARYTPNKAGVAIKLRREFRQPIDAGLKLLGLTGKSYISRNDDPRKRLNRWQEIDGVAREFVTDDPINIKRADIARPFGEVNV
jgi:hypothetical protein